MTDSYSDVFKEEAREKLLELEDALLELEANPEDAEQIGCVFRVMHTIKGSGAMFGFDDIAAFTHEIETVYDKVRDGKIPVTNKLIDLTLQAKDQIKSMLDKSPQGEDPQKPMLQKTISAFKKLASGDEEPTPPTANPSSSWASPPTIQELPLESEVTYRIRLKPAADIFMTGANPLLLLEELRSLGECRVIAQTDAIPRLEDMDPESCYTRWDIILTTDKGTNAIKDVFIFVEDSCEIKIDVIDAGTAAGPEEDYKKLGRILTERGDITEESLNNALNTKKYIGEILVEKGLVTKDKVESALIEQEHVKKIREKAQAKDDGLSSIRVPVEKLDLLVNLVGELVTIQARLTQTASRFCNADFTSIAEEVERLTAELRDNTLNIRMLPIGTTFGRFKRLVRDLSQDLGKEIDLVTDGGETELDKTVIEKLNDPLVHLIRNSIDHGIESPDLRIASGKPRAGTIRLSAIHSGAHVIIRIKDDGKGLDRDAILAKAVSKGLAPPGVELADKEVFGFIFQPGFSTAKEVTNISGRGVGMDVVKRAIETLRGSIEIQSEKNKGTTVTVKLPLTLAIVDGLLVEMGNDHFVIPLYLVEECVELTHEDVLNAHGRDIAYIRGDMVPYVRLRKEFDINGNVPPIEQIVVTGINGDRVGLVVDKVIGEHQTVIKNLGALYRDVEGISGATVLGDGTVALIVDAPQLIKNVEREQKTFQ
jgi:two-component system chemotaxis sensor kinase CheA